MEPTDSVTRANASVWWHQRSDALLERLDALEGHFKQIRQGIKRLETANNATDRSDRSPAYASALTHASAIASTCPDRTPELLHLVGSAPIATDPGNAGDVEALKAVQESMRAVADQLAELRAELANLPKRSAEEVSVGFVPIGISKDTHASRSCSRSAKDHLPGTLDPVDTEAWSWVLQTHQRHDSGWSAVLGNGPYDQAAAEVEAEAICDDSGFTPRQGLPLEPSKSPQSEVHQPGSKTRSDQEVGIGGLALRYKLHSAVDQASEDAATSWEERWQEFQAYVKAFPEQRADSDDSEQLARLASMSYEQYRSEHGCRPTNRSSEDTRLSSQAARRTSSRRSSRQKVTQAMRDEAAEIWLAEAARCEIDDTFAMVQKYLSGEKDHKIPAMLHDASVKEAQRLQIEEDERLAIELAFEQRQLGADQEAGTILSQIRERQRLAALEDAAEDEEDTPEIVKISRKLAKGRGSSRDRSLIDFHRQAKLNRMMLEAKRTRDSVQQSNRNRESAASAATDRCIDRKNASTDRGSFGGHNFIRGFYRKTECGARSYKSRAFADHGTQTFLFMTTSPHSLTDSQDRTSSASPHPRGRGLQDGSVGYTQCRTSKTTKSCSRLPSLLRLEPRWSRSCWSE